jgi:hypothetical protein
MRVTLSFSTFDPLFSDAPSLCDVCESKPSVFHFESHRDDDGPDRPPATGYCCSSCAVDLLDRLQRAESLAWAEEEIAVQSTGGDVTDFHTRRVATFGSSNRN